MRSSSSSLPNILPSSLLALILLSTPTLGLRNASWNNNGPSYDTSVRFGTAERVHLVFNQVFSLFLPLLHQVYGEGYSSGRSHVYLCGMTQENVRRVSTVCCPSSPADNMGTVTHTMANASAHRDGGA